MKIIFIITIIFVIIIIYYNDLTKNINNSRHLTDSYSYAHFSNINSYNYFLNYDFLFNTTNTYIELNEGESIFIPKEVWHWIISDTSTLSLNYWFNKNPNKTISETNNKLTIKCKMWEISSVYHVRKTLNPINNLVLSFFKICYALIL
jgi:hypothetical protein